MRLLIAVLAAAFTAMIFSMNVAEAANHSHGCTGNYYYCSALKGCCLSGEKCRSNGCIGPPRGGVACGEGTCSPDFVCGTQYGKPHCFAK